MGAPLDKLPGWLAAPGALLVGAVQVPAYSPQAFDLPAAWWAQVLSVAGLAWLLRQARSGAQGAWLGWLYGCAWLVAGTGWLYISMHRYGGMPAWMSAAAVLALSAFLSLYLALAMAVFVRMRRGRPALDALLFASLWLAAELARGVLLTGFPWASSGYAHVDGPLAMFAPWLGVYGLGALSAAIAAGLVFTVQRRDLVLMVLAASVLVGLANLAGPGAFTTAAGRLRVTLLQGNIPQDEKFSEERLPDTLTWYGRALVHAQADLVIAPETAIPLLPAQMPQNYWDALREHFASDGRAALIGVPLGDEVHGYSNSVAGLSSLALSLPNGVYRYNKHHLVPFGEFIPYGFHWFVALMNMPLGDFDRGSLVQAPFAVAGADGQMQWVAPNVCYEDLFGEELAARLVGPGDQATVFANVSNIAWFGRSLAVDQHLQISRMRALELQHPMARATNTGATVIIDHNGRVTHRLASYTRGILVGEVEGRRGLTPYAWWVGHLGLWPWLLWVGSMLAWAARAARSGARR